MTKVESKKAKGAGGGARSRGVKYSFLKIMTGSDLSRRRLPFMTAQSGKAGPTVWLTACGHGDEVGGVVVVQEIFKKLRKKRLRRGSLYAFPMMNPMGFETISRMIIYSNEDLNRAFPGNAKGSLAERIAYQIFSSIAQTGPTVVLDLHNDWRRSIPYAVLDSTPKTQDQQAYEQAEKFCRMTGLLPIREAEEVKKTLSHSLLEKNIPALTLELGESFVVSEANIEYGVRSIWNILTQLEMAEKEGPPFQYQIPAALAGRILRYSHQPLSSSSGIIRFLVKPGDLVQKGKIVGKIYNTFGKLLENVPALSDGIVLGHADSSAAFPGVPLVAFGIV